MELLLLIFKIILLAVIAVLGLCLFLIGLLLFVPIRYEVSGSVGDSWEVKIKGRITYLLSLVKLIFSYEEETFDRKLFLFGIEKSSTQEEQPASEGNQTEDKEVSQACEKNSESLYTDDSPAESYSDTEKNSQSDVYKEADIFEDISEEAENTFTEKKRKSFKKHKPKREASEKTFDFAFWKRELTDERNKSVVRKLFSELVYLLKHFRFRRIQTDVVFSTGDPATTGQALGVLCMMPFFYRYQFKIVPDFESDAFYIKGTFLVAGKVRLIHVLITALRLLFDKEVRLVVKKFLVLLDK